MPGRRSAREPEGYGGLPQNRQQVWGMLKSNRVVRVLVSLVLMLGMLMPAMTSPVQAVSALPATLPQSVPGTIEIRADSLGLPLMYHPEAQDYPKPAVYVQTGDRIAFEVTIAQDGEYTVWFDMAAVGDLTVNPPEGSLQVDGDFPLPETRRVVFPLFYQNTSDTFPLDRYGNEILIPQQRLIRWSRVPLRDAAFSHKYPLRIPLAAGVHTFDFRMTRESMLLGSIYLEPFQPYPSYAEYVQNHSAPDSSRVLIALEAEFPSFKNDTAVRPVNNRSLGVTPYDTYRLLLNALGGDSWVRSGSAVYYEFSVPQEGMYHITFRALQNTKSNFTSFRKIILDDQVLFDELSAVPFPYTSDWENISLGGDEPYRIYLTEGRHVLGIEVTLSPYEQAIEKIKKVLLDINDLALEIKSLTGNQVDVYKEWKMSDYIPDLRERLLAIAADLEADVHVLNEINRGVRSQELLAYQMAIENIRFLAEDPDKMPIRLNRFSEGTGSAAQLLGSILPSLQAQPLTLDKIYIHSPDTPPEPVKIPVTTSMVEGVKRFLHSFQPVPYQSIGAGEDEIEVWVNRPRQYVDLMQTLADQQFTPQTGIKVKFSIMPNESKLALAVAAGIQPDVALGISTNIPYELAIRNALYDLRSFEDFDSFIRIYSPGSLLSYIIDDSVYAIPETQDFWVTYYRRDIMGALGLPIPQTWQEVIEILPELQRYGLNYNTPLSSGAGLKGYLVTAPYIFNHGAQLYTPDGMSGLGSEEAINAIRFMAESFTIYGMPLTTANFYDRFRYGSIPIGISNFETYIKLLTAAPEIDGLWGMSLYPATVLPDGRQLRYATGSAQACIMFADTDKPGESWTFLKWWMSTETQKTFQQELILNYGREYLWNSANLEAFQALPIPEEHKEVILEQWQWLQEPVKLPGSYMQERELSNVWNRIVFDGANPRVAIDNAVVVINREILRKMEEFGYIQNGVRVKEIKVPSIETVKGWMENADR